MDSARTKNASLRSPISPKSFASIICLLLLVSPPLSLVAAVKAPDASPIIQEGPRIPHFTASARSYPVVLPPNYYLYINVDNPYAGSIQLVFSLTSNVEVDVYVMNQGQFSAYQSGGSTSSVYHSSGTSVASRTTLSASTEYYFVVDNDVSHSSAIIQVSVYTDPVNVYTSYSVLPAPIGIADYGVTNSAGAVHAYEVLTDGVTGIANITSLGAYNPSPPKGVDQHGSGLQLNVVLGVNTTRGEFVYWLQNFLSFHSDTNLLYYVVNVWNMTAPSANMNSAYISGAGRVYNYSSGTTFYASGTNYISYSLPYQVSMPITVSQTSDGAVVNFGYQVTESGSPIPVATTVTYDTVTITEPASVTKASIVIDGFKTNPAGLYYDAEFVFGGEGSGEHTSFTSMDATLNMIYQYSRGSFLQPRSLYEFGGNTGEAADNLQTQQSKGHFLVSTGAADFQRNYVLPGGVLIPLTLSYTVVGGAGSASPPGFTYTSWGFTSTAALTSSPTVYYLDSGTAWSITTSFPNSSSERWFSREATSGVASSVETLSITYYHQYSVSFEYTGGGPSTSPPSVTYEQSGAQQTAAIGSQVWADAGSTYSYQPTLAGSTSSERWSTPSSAGTVSTPGAVSAVYFHQYSLQFAYSITGGGTPPSGPAINSTSLGTSISLTVPPGGTAEWLDAGAQWTIPLSLPGPTGSERWLTTSANSGRVNGATSISLVYYHQYEITAGYTVVGGGAPGTPHLNSTSTGSTVSTALSEKGVSAWLDAGAPYALSNTLPGSKSSERWATEANALGTVSGPLNIEATYYHQFILGTSFAIVGGGAPPPPVLNSSAFGAALSQALTSEPLALWLDSGASWSLTNPLKGSNSTVRWYSASQFSGTVASPISVNGTFFHQYFVTISAPAAGGTVSNATGWYDNGAPVHLSASASAGWKFEMWSGTGASSYSGSSNSTAVPVHAPIMEGAIFYPGLNIFATPGGSVYYAYGSTSGSVQGSETVYVPGGTIVALSESPASFLNAFVSWSGAATGTNDTVSVSVSFPSTVEAAFGYNYVNVAVVFGVVVAVAAAMFVALRRRKKQQGLQPPLT